MMLIHGSIVLRETEKMLFASTLHFKAIRAGKMQLLPAGAAILTWICKQREWELARF
jgi:hypothetical protein